jgi:hypothetical protein
MACTLAGCVNTTGKVVAQQRDLYVARGSD